MQPRLRAFVVLAILGLVLAGLLLAGPAHLVTHSPGEGHACDACLVQAALPLPPYAPLGLVQLARRTPVPAALRLTDPLLHLLPPPRGPPTPA